MQDMNAAIAQALSQVFNRPSYARVVKVDDFEEGVDDAGQPLLSAAVTVCRSQPYKFAKLHHGCIIYMRGFVSRPLLDSLRLQR